jgi:hypothetical protein
MRGTCVFRSYTHPLREVPDVGQVCEYSSESPGIGKEAADVFHEDERGSSLANHSKESFPKPSLVISAELLACNGERLTRNAPRNEIHKSLPRSPIERSEIVPYRCFIQGFVFHPRHESGCGVGFPLDETNATQSVSEDEFEGEIDPSASSAS